jgi:predicted acyltransferase
LWKLLGHQFEHAEWTGCTLWDLIQPAFMFMVGVALPWSVASRAARGQSFGMMFVHALWRALLLVLLAVFLASAWSDQTEWVFTNVLAQIGLGYPLLFLLAFARTRTQWLAAIGILVAYWLAFALHPLPPPDFDWQSVGVPEDWNHLAGFAAHWEKNANFAASFDVWFLNLFPRSTPFAFSEGGYQTLNFFPSLATMIFGLLAGELLRGERSIADKVARLVVWGVAGMILGQLLAAAGLCPIVKRIWTPTWALYSGGLVTLMLAAFVAIID